MLGFLTGLYPASFEGRIHYKFASVYYQGILGLLGIASNYTSPYHPQTNGQLERYNRTLVRKLRCYIAEHQEEWDSHLSLLTTAYNTQVHASTGDIPFAYVSLRRLQLIGMERIPRLKKAEERTEEASTAAEQYVRTLGPSSRRFVGSWAKPRPRRSRRLTPALRRRTTRSRPGTGSI